MQSLTITAADLAPIPYIERCDYSEFLARLAQIHGASYLCRPDGTLLAGVVAIPQVRTRHKPKRQAPTLPDSYTGNPMSDMHPQMRGIVVVEERTHADGSTSMTTVQSVKARVLAALKDGPLTLGEIIKATGLANGQVKNALHRWNGTLLERATNRAANNKWRLMGDQARATVQTQREMTVRERIEQYIAENGPTTATSLAVRLGLKRDLVYATCYAAGTLAVVGKSNGKSVLWGLSNAQTQMAKAA